MSALRPRFARGVLTWIPTDRTLLLILTSAFLLRVLVASTAAYLPDEDELAIPIAKTISFSPSAPNLPLRGPHHPALPYYFVKISSEIAGVSPLGYRFVHVLIGLVMILLVFRIATDWFGHVAALWAAALLAFNEYHVGVSAFATAKGPHLLFLAIAIYAFCRFLKTERPAFLYLAGAMTGLGFYCKEHSALLLPVFFLVLCRRPYRHWLGRGETYLAALLFALVIAPDVAWNAGVDTGEERYTYRDHLSRIGGIGFTPDYFMFFVRGAIQTTAVALTGDEVPDSVSENWSMNSILGLVLFSSMAIFTLRDRRHGLWMFLVTLFWGVLLFFMFVDPGETTRPLDRTAWYWIDVTLFPAVIAAGCRLDRAMQPGLRLLQWGAWASMIYAWWRPITLLLTP